MKTALNSLQAIENEALAHFKKHDPTLYKAILPFHGTIRDRVQVKKTNHALFEALAGSIIGQQLSTKAAESIRARVVVACGGRIQPQTIHDASDVALRAAGLSSAKVKSLRGLSSAVLSKDLNLLSLKRFAPEVAVEKLVSLWGIGPWTAEMFLMFSLGATDIFSPGDLILARGVEELYGLPKGTPRAEIEHITARWSPYRTYASLFLWQRNDMAKKKLLS